MHVCYNGWFTWCCTVHAGNIKYSTMRRCTYIRTMDIVIAELCTSVYIRHYGRVVACSDPAWLMQVGRSCRRVMRHFVTVSLTSKLSPAVLMRAFVSVAFKSLGDLYHTMIRDALQTFVYLMYGCMYWCIDATVLYLYYLHWLQSYKSTELRSSCNILI